MLKIVEFHEATTAQGEYLVLQNQGLSTVSLRGWGLCTDAFLEANMTRVVSEMFVFQEDIPVKPYTRVVVFTGAGESGWVPTTDGKQAYCAYWGRAERIWSGAANVHLLHIAGTRAVRTAPVPVGKPLQALHSEGGA